jgi:hypothetical protein
MVTNAQPPADTTPLDLCDEICDTCGLVWSRCSCYVPSQESLTERGPIESDIVLEGCLTGPSPSGAVRSVRVRLIISSGWIA